MDPEYLSILMCPKTKGALRMATGDEVARVNAAVEAGTVEVERFEAGLVSENGNLIYPIRDGIPVLLADAALVLASDGGIAPSESAK